MGAISDPDPPKADDVPQPMSDIQPSGSRSFLITTPDGENGDVFDVIYLIATAFSGGADPIAPCAP